MACSLAPGPGTTSTTRVRYITGHIISAACGIRIASTTATGLSSAIRGSMIMTGDLENSTSMILIVDAGSVESGNFAGTILTVGMDLTTGAILTGGMDSAKAGSSMIAAGAMRATEVVDAARVMGGTTADAANKEGRLIYGLAAETASHFCCDNFEHLPAIKP